MPRRVRLRALADRLGILPSFTSSTGARRFTSDATRVALLAAMGFDATDEERAARGLAELDREGAERLLARARVVRQESDEAGSALLSIPATGGAGGDRGRGGAPLEWRLELVEEDGETYTSEGRFEASAGAAPRADAGESPGPDADGIAPAARIVSLPLPSRPGLGYHVLRAEVLSPGGATRRAEQSLIVVPPSCVTAHDLLGGRRVFGICANLYTARSAGNWGIGNLADLAALARWSGEIGAAFVGINPLHALRNRGSEISPYYGMSRLYRNPLYIDVEAVPELAECESARARIASATFVRERDRARAAEHVDYEGIAALERPILEALHETFAKRHRGRDTARGRAHAAYLAREGQPLTDFATFLALEEHFARAAQAAPSWHAWPADYRDPRSAAVSAFRDAHEDEVDFHRYLQFEIDRQLGEAAAAARAAGLAIGIYQDLAVGAAGGGSDPWAFPGLFSSGASVGAPPDYYAQTGQDWGLPPIDPRRLAADGYRYWIRLLRGALAHSGALRIDHVMGVLRQFWIPVGRPPSEGGYVRYPAEDLLGILALESARHGALIVGEDLGTVPPGFTELLARWGILSSQVLYFSGDARHGYPAASRFSDRALVTVNSHDLPPLAGFWRGADIALRRRIGALATGAAQEAALAEREGVRRAILNRLAVEGLLPGAARGAPADAADIAGVASAVHAFLSRTPAPLVGISLDDLAGETEPVNVPGTSPSEYPSWSRRMRLSLEEIARDPGAALALEGARERAAGAEPPSGAGAPGARNKHAALEPARGPARAMGGD